jgi:hypothetical protein
MSKGHPIAYFTVLEILKRLHDLGDVSNVKLVQTTGPDALKAGYIAALSTTEGPKSAMNYGTHVSITSIVGVDVCFWI